MGRGDEGRTVLVTGGTGALGQGVVEQLVQAGQRVIATWIVEREAEALREAFGERVQLVALDVGDGEAVARVVGGIESDDGPWGLVHLVGGYLADTPVAEMTMEQWDRQMALNARSFATMLRAVLPGMVARGGGRVVGVGTRAALAPFAGASAYAASKAALLALVRAASEEVKHDGVCVNAIVPSIIDTPANRAASPDADASRWVAPADIGAVVAFLVSDAARAVTGAAIPVYGRC